MMLSKFSLMFDCLEYDCHHQYRSVRKRNTTLHHVLGVRLKPMSMYIRPLRGLGMVYTSDERRGWDLCATWRWTKERRSSRADGTTTSERTGARFRYRGDRPAVMRSCIARVYVYRPNNTLHVDGALAGARDSSRLWVIRWPCWEVATEDWRAREQNTSRVTSGLTTVRRRR